MSSVLIFLASALLAWLLCFPVRHLLVRFGVIDRPNHRSSHSLPTARGGGIAIWLAAVLVFGAVAGGTKMQSHAHGAAVLGAAILLAGISFLDDLWSLPMWLRLVCQVLLGAMALFVIFPSGDSLPVGLNSPLMSVLVVAFCLLWIVGSTNVFNFMDGINGLAAGQAVITASGTALLAQRAGLPWNHDAIVIALLVAGSAAGFLPHNFPRARVFMGDSGSAGLGFILAVLPVWICRQTGWQWFPMFLFLNANFILDTTITLARRIWRREQWHKPHREHFYQRLVRGGKSHAFATGWELFLQGVVFTLIMMTPNPSVDFYSGLAVFVLVLWLGFFCFAEAIFRRHSVSTER